MPESIEEKEHQSDPELSGYKDQILPVNRSGLTLQRDLYFVGTTQRGYEVEYDVRYEEGCSPTETFLLSIAGCISIDVVHILRKMRCEISHYEMSAEGTRNLTPPQYYTSVNLMIQLSGKGITAQEDRQSD